MVFISPIFTVHQQEAIGFKDLPIELWVVKRFSNNTVIYDKIKSTESLASIKTVSKKSKEIAKVSKEIKVYTEENVLKKANEQIQEITLELKEAILQLDEDIKEKITKVMLCYYSGGKGMVWLDPFRNKIRIYLRKGKYKDKLNKIKPKGWGGYAELTVTEKEFEDYEYMKYVKNLFMQAYNK